MIHQNDDYKTLIELLYPSIEASGNVYYGQTRKLIMDEILDKNDLGFESHIDSIRVKDSSADYGFIYKKYFYWKLGPWSDSFEYEEDIDYGVYYGKYKLNIENRKIDEELHSGSFSSYEKDITPEFNGIALTGGDDPTEKEEYDGRNFYILKEDNNYYLYIAVPQSKNQCSKPLTLTAVGGSTKIRIVAYVNENEQAPVTGNDKWYEYKKNNGSWIGYDGSFIELENGDSVSFRSTEFRPKFTLTTYARFDYDSPNTEADTRIKATGSISSMSVYNKTASNCKCNYYELFYNCDILSAAPKIPGKTAHNSEYRKTFCNCVNLISVPKELPATELLLSCYFETFSGCISIETAPYLPAAELPNYCYSHMFYNCESLSEVRCNAQSAESSTSLEEWLYNTSQEGTFYCNENSVQAAFTRDSDIPVGWKVRDINNTHATCMMYCKYDPAGPVIRYGRDFASYTKDDKVIKFTPSKTVDLGESGESGEIHGIEFVGFDNENVLDENDILPGNIHFSGSLTGHLIDSYNETTTSGAVTNRNKYNHGIMITSGSNSDSNGRGDITTQSTLSNMEKSFDENNNHPMNTYNTDGSYNQEIWGYKCFNSPVQFRNGVYTDEARITHSALYSDYNASQEFVLCSNDEYTPRYVLLRDNNESDKYISFLGSSDLDSPLYIDVSNIIDNIAVYNGSIVECIFEHAENSKTSLSLMSSANSNDTIIVGERTKLNNYSLFCGANVFKEIDNAIYSTSNNIITSHLSLIDDNNNRISYDACVNTAATYSDGLTDPTVTISSSTTSTDGVNPISVNTSCNISVTPEKIKFSFYYTNNQYDVAKITKDGIELENATLTGNSNVKLHSDNNFTVLDVNDNAVFSANSSGITIKDLTSAGNIIPNNSNVNTIGDSDHVYKDVYTTNIHGKIPTGYTTTYKHHVEIGGITLITIKKLTPQIQQLVYRAGDELSTLDENYEILPCTLIYDGSVKLGPSVFGSNDLQWDANYTFRLLSNGALNSNYNEVYVIVLAMRVE